MSRLLIFGGSFNPPHRGHVDALQTAQAYLRAQRVLVIPGNLPPHKSVEAGSPTACERLELARLAFSAVPEAEVSDMELCRGGVSYSVDTLSALAAQFPQTERLLLTGTDMFLSLEQWYRFERLLTLCVPAVIPRNEGEEWYIQAYAAYLQKRYGVVCAIVPRPKKLPMCSTDLRAELRARRGRAELPPGVYAEIIRRRYYGAKPELRWLRESVYPYLDPGRIPHVAGCEDTATRLARRWGEDADSAAECAILHDISKKIRGGDQLRLCDEYGIIPDIVERQQTMLLHAKTGAAMARRLFGADDAVCGAVRWHTTGKPDMTRLEKILYLADAMEPNRSYEGVEALRAAAFEDLDGAMILGLRMSLAAVCARGHEPHPATQEALVWIEEHRKEAL